MIESTPKNSRSEENSKDQLPKNSDGKLPLFYSAVMQQCGTAATGQIGPSESIRIMLLLVPLIEEEAAAAAAT
jgi:hypothetical protein